MKLNRIFFVSAAVLAAAACSDIENIVPEGGTMLASQVQKTNEILPQRANATFSGLFTHIGEPDKMYSTPDDWGFLMINFCNDLEGADAHIVDNNYNWFSPCGEYSSRNPDYRNPYIRYRAPYNLIGGVNTFLSGFSGEVTDPSSLNMIAQSLVLRAYSYLTLAPDFQFNYQIAADKPCVPLVTENTTDFANNPRVSVKEIYDQILSDLNSAIETLEKPEIKSIARVSKMYIDAQVAHGLRARAYLDMGEWQKAYDDAVAAAEGYSPATIADLSKPSFMDIKEANWIWGFDMTADMALSNRQATTSGWLRSFSSWAYAPATQTYALVNTLLWNKIDPDDVRKGWWVDENLESPLLKGLAWPGFPDVANADNGDDKLPFLPYTNVKFGCNSIGTTVNDEDMPLMRVEEMILIQAECLARLGKTGEATTLLTDFVGTYREPGYTVTERGLKLLDEIWFQRRVELWGEGFFMRDMKRLQKPLVRTHGSGTTNISDAFAFNMEANDGWLLMRFAQGETNTNFGIVNNSEGQIPTMGQNPDLKDGVTD